MSPREFIPFLQRHREDCIDLALLWLALQLAAGTGAGPELPMLSQLIVLLAAGFCLPRKPAREGPAWRQALGRLPGKLVAIAAAAAIFLFWSNLPARSLAFGPIWLGLVLARPPLEAAVRRGYRVDLAAGIALILGGGGWIACRLATPGATAWAISAGAGLAVLLALYAFALRRAARRGLDVPQENLRWIALAAGAAWLLHRFVTRAQYGTDDARWYATMLADFRAQVRAGILPVSVGQTPWQFNGAVFSFRLAPAYHYLGALLDQLTWRSLEVYALQHLLLLGLGLGAAFSAYAALASILPRRRWTAAALAWLWLACPGVAGLAFNTDLYMTWTTLPAIPWIVLGWRRVWDPAAERPAWLSLGIALGWTWWGHTPMAVWMSFVTAGVGVAWVIARRPGLGRLAAAALGAAICLGLAAFPLLSYLEAIRRIGLGPQGFSSTDAGTISLFVRRAFPGVLLPISIHGRQLADFQLGWALWAALALALAQAWRAPRAERTVLAAVGIVLVLLLTPVPWLNHALWTAVPAAVRNATTNWAMNRLYLILAMVAAAGAAGALAGRSTPLPRWGMGAGVCLLLWSTWEAGRFSTLAPLHAGSDAAQMLPENIAVTRNAYVVFPRFPAYYSEGVVDPALENRLAGNDGRPFLTNVSAAAAAAQVVQTGQFRVVDDQGSRFLELEAPLELKPGRRYLLEFDYVNPDWPGVLLFSGPTLFRQYGLPEYGEAESFGIGGQHSHLLPLSVSGSASESIRARFIPNDAGRLPGLGLPAWATVRLLDYDPAVLPVRVSSWIPYRAEVRSEHAAWVETPRMFQQGYEARVNGAPAEIRRSPQSLAMVAIPAGDSKVELRYRPSALFVAAFWFSVAGWCMAAAAGVRRLARR